jgi:integrase
MKFSPTGTPNLVRSQNNTYFLRARIGGRLVWKSLETNTHSIAKLRLPDLLREMRKSILGAVEAKIESNTTFAQAVVLYRTEINANLRLKETSKHFRLRSEHTLRRTWPQLFDRELRRITADDCLDWQRRFEGGACVYKPINAKQRTLKGNSPTTINAVIRFLRHVFAIGMKYGIIYKNPAAAMQGKPVRKKLLRLPNRTQFAAVVAHVRAQFGWGRASADLIEGLAYSGMRVGESRRFIWSLADFEKNLVTILGEKTASAPRTIPMTPAFRGLLERIMVHTPPQAAGRVFEVGSALASLKSACKAVGVAPLTHHDLRHLFATTCIESGVDIPTVALWLGHSDGGTLAMQTYGHIRPEHSNRAAKRVDFTPPASTHAYPPRTSPFINPRFEPRYALASFRLSLKIPAGSFLSALAAQLMKTNARKLEINTPDWHAAVATFEALGVPGATTAASTAILADLRAGIIDVWLVGDETLHLTESGSIPDGVEAA